jgi:phage shock protein A
MSLLGRLRRAIASRAGAVDKAADPRKEMDRVIGELEQTLRDARRELLQFKTTEKQLSRDIEACEARIGDWERRAMDAVRAGADGLARDALAEKKRCEQQRLELGRDRDEARGYALELNRSRKQVETRLRILQLKRGTMAQQIAIGRGGPGPLGDDRVFDRMKEAEDRIEEQAIAAEVDELLGLDGPGSGEALQSLEKQTTQVEADQALRQLKARMAEERRRKALGAKKQPGGGGEAP